MSATGRGWLASAAPIVLWIAHLTAVAAIVEPVCREGIAWVTHALTVGLAVACLPFLALAWSLTRRPSPGDAGETPDDLRFLGWLGVGLGAVSLLLIVAEGLFATGIDPCA